VSGTIVVGVDGSEAAHEALLFAAEEAKLRDAKLLAIHAWIYIPAPVAGDPALMAMPEGDVPGVLEAERDSAQKTLERALQEAFPGGPPVEFESRLVEDDAGDALVAAAADAELAVVGTRGRGDLTSALLGSVSSHVVHHAPCPVVVVKASTKS
jgi:nucleotide-binding universal stress UspA family protein